MKRIFSADRSEIEHRKQMNCMDRDVQRSCNFVPGFKLIELHSSLKDTFSEQFDTTHFMSRGLNTLPNKLSDSNQTSCTDEGLIKFSRDYQLTTAAAGTGGRAAHFLNEALSCHKPKFLNMNQLSMDAKTGETRTSELTPLMIACIMGQLNMV